MAKRTGTLGDRAGMSKMINRSAIGAVLGALLLLTGPARTECAAQGNSGAGPRLIAPTPDSPGTPIPPGPPPPPGGASCWDLNANGVCDPAREDRNGDRRCDESDCPPGPREDPNSPAPPPPPGGGAACWDLNANGTCEPAQEDRNGDGRCNELDCPPGPPEEEYLRMLQKGARP